MISNKKKDQKIFVIAELSANHNHKKDIAIETVRAAKRAGADAIKLQTYTPDTLTIDCDNQYFSIKEGIWKGKSLYELYKEAYTPWEWHEDIFRVAKEEGLVCFSTPFDKTSVDFLEELNNPIYKIASFEIQDVPLIQYTASKGKPMIISTGIAEYEDIGLAVKTCREAGNNDITLLKCTSAYPAPIEEANIITMKDLKKSFNVNVGLSDHTPGITAPVVAAALGASVIEKHFIIEKSIGGPDASFSLDANEFSYMVKTIREAEKSIGQVSYSLTEKVKQNRVFGRSLFVVQNIKKGEPFDENNLMSIRPGFGIHPKYYYSIIGKIAAKDIPRGTPLKWEYVEQKV
jgi:pseudaminic acid synthase